MILKLELEFGKTLYHDSFYPAEIWSELLFETFINSLPIEHWGDSLDTFADHVFKNYNETITNTPTTAYDVWIEVTKRQKDLEDDFSHPFHSCIFRYGTEQWDQMIKSLLLQCYLKNYC